MKPPRALPILSVALFAAAARGEVIERVIVKVNGDIVTQSEFEARQIAAVQQARVAPDQVEKFLRENNAHILQEAIDDLLLVQRATDLGIKLRPEYVKEVIEGIKKENKIASDDELQQQLKREGMTLEELKRNIERNVLKRQVMQRELESKIAVTEDDTRAWYEANKADYTKPATVHLQQLLVRSDTKNPSLAVDLVGRARQSGRGDIDDAADPARARSAPADRHSHAFAHSDPAPAGVIASAFRWRRAATPSLRAFMRPSARSRAVGSRPTDSSPASSACPAGRGRWAGPCGR